MGVCCWSEAVGPGPACWARDLSAAAKDLPPPPPPAEAWVTWEEEGTGTVPDPGPGPGTECPVELRCLLPLTVAAAPLDPFEEDITGFWLATETSETK